MSVYIQACEIVNKLEKKFGWTEDEQTAEQHWRRLDRIVADLEVRRQAKYIVQRRLKEALAREDEFSHYDYMD